MVYKTKRTETKQEYVETEFIDEMHGLEASLGYSFEQVRLLYRTFGRRTKEIGRFLMSEYRALLTSLGIDRSEVCTLIYKAFAKKMPPPEGKQGKPTLVLTYQQAAESMATFGVGTREAQAEALFRCADVNRNLELSRAEMLKFLEDNRCKSVKV